MIFDVFQDSFVNFFKFLKQASNDRCFLIPIDILIEYFRVDEVEGMFGPFYQSWFPRLAIHPFLTLGIKIFL